MAECKEILVPVDGSEGSHRAARLAARMASALGVPLKFLHVIPATPESIMAMSKMSREDIAAIEQERGGTVIAAARAAIGETGAGAEALIIVGDPAEEILTYMDRHKDSMVVLGRRGLSRFQTIVLGSVSEKVMRYARGPVTVVT